MQSIKNPILRGTIQLVVMLACSLILPLGIKQFILRPIRFGVLGDAPLGQVLQWATSLVLILVGYRLSVRLLDGSPDEDLLPAKAFPHLIRSAAWGFGAIGISLLILALFGVFSIQGTHPPVGPLRLILVLFLLSTTEEILYRGILFRLTQSWFNTWFALALSSGLFSIMHLTNDHFTAASFLAILSGGSVMGLLYAVTRSLWWPIGAHFAWNFSQALLGIRLSGTDEFSGLALVRSRLSGLSVLTGGEFGLENSVVVIIVTTVIAIVLGWVFHRSGHRTDRPN